MKAYYDREADIIYIRIYDDPVSPVTADEQPWGLFEHDATRALVAIEIWNVSKLPKPGET